MKSQTLSQFQSVMQELNEFGRGKDKTKRKGRGGAIAKGVAGAAGVGALGTAGVAGVGLAGKGSEPLRKRAGAQLRALGSTIKNRELKDLGANAKGIAKVGKSAVKVGGSKLAFLARKILTKGK